MIQLLRRRKVYHFLIWAISILTFAAIIFFDEENTAVLSSLQEALFNFAPVIVTTYLAFWAKEKLFDRRQYLLYLVAAIAIVIVGVTIYETLDSLDGTMGNPRNQNIGNFIFIQVFVVGLQYFKRGIVNQYQLQELQAKKAMTELNALKAQINPHFLFNTLNNIYGMNQIDSERGSEMILELSEVMRYHLEFSKQGQVKLADEIQLLESYIKLEQLRLRQTCDVQVNLENVDEDLMISPLLFLPFVENAFKHGTHPIKKCFVHIELSSIENKIHFVVKNSMIANRKVVKTHIGLKNTRRRLELLFPEKHHLYIVQDEFCHLVELSIDL